MDLLRTLRSCCCGCTLKTGTLMLLWTVVVIGVMNLTLSISSYTYAQVTVPAIVVDFVMKAGIIGISIQAIYGSNKKKPQLMIPFLGLQVLGMGVIMFEMISSIFEVGKSFSVGIIISKEFFLLCFEALMYYLFLVVLSYYRELREWLAPSGLEMVEIT